MNPQEFSVVFARVKSDLFRLVEAAEDKPDICGSLPIEDFMLFSNLCKELQYWGG